MSQVVTLIGGSRDGESVEVHSWQPLVYMTRRITPVESQSLRIDDIHGWKPPEDVYVRGDKQWFVYDRTIHYKPTDGAIL